MASNKTECASCNEMIDNDEVTYCPDCDAPICHTCLDEGCQCCMSEDDWDGADVIDEDE